MCMHVCLDNCKDAIQDVLNRGSAVSSFPGLARSTLAVQSLRRRAGLVHHVIRPTGYITTISLRINDVIG